MNLSFLSKYKVLIIGLISAIALALNDLIVQNETHVKVLVFAGLLAGFSFLANNLRGQWGSIAGIFGTALTTYVTMEKTGTISWPQIIMQAVIAYLAVVAPPPKSRGYEHTATIEQAKFQGEKKMPTTIGSK